MTCTAILNSVSEHWRLAWPYIEWFTWWFVTFLLFGSGIGIFAFLTIIVLLSLYAEGKLNRWLPEKYQMKL